MSFLYIYQTSYLVLTNFHFLFIILSKFSQRIQSFVKRTSEFVVFTFIILEHFVSSQLLFCFYANTEIPCLVLDSGESIELIVAPF